ncbi:MAG: flagellar hook-basal body protein [Limisphaerales bacterium]
MNVSLYQAAAALNANSRWQDVIAENLASSSVPGYRKQSLSTAAAQAGLLSANGGSPQYFNVPQTKISTSFQSGELNYSGDDKNAAIEGKGFFKIQLANNITAVTRDGEFHVSSRGQLVTKEGYTVLGQNGPIQLDFHNRDPISISSTGEVSQGSDVKGKLSLTDYENPELLTPTNGVFFLATNPGLRAKPATGSVRDGYVEGANTTALGEMANMMTAQRGFEANQKVIQIQDERMGKVISDLGNLGPS